MSCLGVSRFAVGEDTNVPVRLAMGCSAVGSEHLRAEVSAAFSFIATARSQCSRTCRLSGDKFTSTLAKECESRREITTLRTLQQIRLYKKSLHLGNSTIRINTGKADVELLEGIPRD